MIVYTSEDVVFLSGALTRNQWHTIKAAANLLLHEFPEGIIIDCSELTLVDEEGARTLLEAIRDIESAHARMMVTNIPESVMQQIKEIPGVRSQVAIAQSVDEARISLRTGGTGLPTEASRSVLVPVLAGLDIEGAVDIAIQVARTERLSIVIVNLLEVDRNLPLGSPLPEQEAKAQKLLDAAAAPVKQQGLKVSVHTERVREAREGLLQEIERHNVTYLILSGKPAQFQDPEFMDRIHMFLQRAPCNVIVGRQSP